VETSEVQHKLEAGAESGGLQCRDIALDEPHLDFGFTHTLTRGAQSLRNDSTAVTCHPRRANSTACIPVPQPRSSAGP
jgi:hypothetical protein